MEASNPYATICAQPFFKHLSRLASSTSTITALVPKSSRSTRFLRRCSSAATSTAGDGKLKLSGRTRRSSSSTTSPPSSTSDREAVRAIRLKKVLLYLLINAQYSTPPHLFFFLDFLDLAGHSCCRVRLKS